MGKYECGRGREEGEFHELRFLCTLSETNVYARRRCDAQIVKRAKQREAVAPRFLDLF